MDCWLILRRILTKVWLKNLVPKVSLSICKEKSIKSISRQFAFLLPSCWLPTSCISSSFAGQPQMQTRLSPWQIRGLHKFFLTIILFPRLPEISVCPVPPFNLTAMASKGYPNVYNYYLGLNGSLASPNSEHFVGWGGNDFENPHQLLENLTTLSKNRIVNGPNGSNILGTF